MFALLLVACAIEGRDSGEALRPLDVDVYPGTVSATFHGSNEQDYESVSTVIGTVRVESYEADPLLVETHATSTIQDLTETAGPWIDATFQESSGDYYEIEGGGNHWRVDLDVWLYGVAVDALEPGDHSFALEVLVGGQSYPIEAVVTLE